MFGLGIHYLMGWAMAAADGAEEKVPEWPPHPDRVFMALADAWSESGQDAAEGEALRWLEDLPHLPGLCASDHRPRDLVTHFVPVNDTGTPFEDEKHGKLAMPSGELQLGRPRRPRSFPVAIPFDPVVHLTWDAEIPEAQQAPLERLCRKVSRIGHSASLVQMWLETKPPAATLVPTDGIAQQRLRVFGPGRLTYLQRRMNRQAWLVYHDLKAQIEQGKATLAEMIQPPRIPWQGFPDVVLLAKESEVKQHPTYRAAKAGGAQAAAELVQSLVSDSGIDRVRRLLDGIGLAAEQTALVSAHAYEQRGVNAIPAALAELLSERLGLDYEPGLVQVNVVAHTGADGYGRLARQAGFDGPVDKRRNYVMVGDFVGQGGTLANLRGQVHKKGARVVGAICLTGKPYSAKLALDKEQLHDLRQRHGKSLESWWKEHFGHPFDCLTQSEARYLARSPDADEIRNRIAAAKRAGGGSGNARSPREQRAFLAQLEAQRAAQFPDGAPSSLRPEPARWQGYTGPAPARTPSPSGGRFDRNLVVLALFGKRLPLPASLKLIEALRGALLSACPEPIPEWVSGHDAQGRASRYPHLAFLPLPFVGREHADGRLMGVALALPRDLDPEVSGSVLVPWLRDSHGLPGAL